MAAAGLGTSCDEFGTYPRHWEVSIVIDSKPMVEILAKPTIGELPVEGTHWRRMPADFVVKSVVLHRGPGLGYVEGFSKDTIDNDGTTAYMTLLPYELIITEEMQIKRFREYCKRVWAKRQKLHADKEMNKPVDERLLHRDRDAAIFE